MMVECFSYQNYHNKAKLSYKRPLYKSMECTSRNVLKNLIHIIIIIMNDDDKEIVCEKEGEMRLGVKGRNLQQPKK